MQFDQKIYVAGHRGMVGSALLRLMQCNGYTRIITATRAELDLRQQAAVMAFFDKHRPQVLIMSAARVGGIGANRSAPADFLFENVAIQNNMFDASLRYGVERIVYLGSSCIYPAQCPQPMREEYLLTGSLEPTNEGYALAKIVGLKLAQYFYDQHRISTISLMPCNLYGTNDHFDLERSHVLSALVRRFADAYDEQLPSVALWGSGKARREFMHVDDLARAVLFLDSKWHGPEFLNVGTGEDITIKELATIIAEQTGYGGEILWDERKPDGMARKLLDCTRLRATGFRTEISLEAGIAKTIREYRELKAAGYTAKREPPRS